MNTPQLILASASPRRVELLQQMAVEFIQQVADIDETHRSGESAMDFVSRLAEEKALKVYAQNKKKQGTKALPVLGSDTIVVVDEHILGKPEDYQHACEMLKMLSGRQHQVMTAVTLVINGKHETLVNSSDVTFMALDQQIIDAYWQTGESIGKAGGYAIQGMAGQFIKEIRGSYSSIMGLPLYETRMLLQQAGIPVLGKI